MGSDVTESFQTSVGAFGETDDPEKAFMKHIGDPFGLFGTGATEEIEAEGVAAKQRIQSFMRAANTMRQNVLARIQERDLQASKAAAGARRAASLRTGRASTILTR